MKAPTCWSDSDGKADSGNPISSGYEDRWWLRAIYRRIWDNPVFRSEQEAAVFVWMISTAQWRETTLRTQFGPITLGVGEVLVAERSLSDRFGLHRNSVRDLLNRMVETNMVTVFRDRCPHRAGTVLRIINYEEYQSLEPASADARDRRRTEGRSEEGPKRDQEQYREGR